MTHINRQTASEVTNNGHKYPHVSTEKTKENRGRNVQNLNEIISWDVAQKKSVKNETVSFSKAAHAQQVFSQ